MTKIASFGVGCLLVLGPCAFGQAAAPDPVPTTTVEQAKVEQAKSAQSFVDEKLAVWKQRLKLEDWKVSAVMTHQTDLAPKTLGGSVLERFGDGPKHRESLSSSGAGATPARVPHPMV